MNRRDFLYSSLLATGAGSFGSALFGAQSESDAKSINSDVRITSVDVVVTNPEQKPQGNYVLVRIATNQPGLYGWGDATCTGSELGVATFLEEHLKPALIGRNPMRTENIWQTLYHLPYYRSGSVHLSAISGIDMALWDIKGKVAGLPVYELLGGKTRTRLLTYRSVSGSDFSEVEDNARQLMEIGYQVIKVQVATPGLESGYAVPSSTRQRADDAQAYTAGRPPSQIWEPGAYVRTLPKLFAHLRDKLGDSIELLHDVHERVTPSQALRLARELEPYHLFYYEDPLRPEHVDTFRAMRQQSSIPVAMGEIYTGKWEGLELITEHLIDYVRHDLAHVGGVTAGKKIATLAEPYGIQTAWHGPGNISPISHMANAHVSYSIPNFGIQEFSVGWGEAVREVFSSLPVYDEGHITIGDAPGLGIDVDIEKARSLPYIRRLRPTIRRADDTPWAY